MNTHLFTAMTALEWRAIRIEKTHQIYGLIVHAHLHLTLKIAADGASND